MRMYLHLRLREAVTEAAALDKSEKWLPIEEYVHFLYKIVTEFVCHCLFSFDVFLFDLLLDLLLIAVVVLLLLLLCILLLLSPLLLLLLLLFLLEVCPVVGKIGGGGGDEAGALRVLLGPLGRKALGLESVPPDEGQDAELRIGLLMLVEKPEVPEQLPVFLLHLRVLKLLLERGAPRELGAFLSTREVPFHFLLEGVNDELEEGIILFLLLGQLLLGLASPVPQLRQNRVVGLLLLLGLPLPVGQVMSFLQCLHFFFLLLPPPHRVTGVERRLRLPQTP